MRPNKVQNKLCRFLSVELAGDLDKTRQDVAKGGQGCRFAAIVWSDKHIHMLVKCKCDVLQRTQVREAQIHDWHRQPPEGWLICHGRIEETALYVKKIHGIFVEQQSQGPSQNQSTHSAGGEQEA